MIRAVFQKDYSGYWVESISERGKTGHGEANSNGSSHEGKRSQGMDQRYEGKMSVVTGPVLGAGMGVR